MTVLRTRSISAELNDCKVVKSLSRDTLQGGVLSPLLWLLVMGRILKKLQESKIKAVDYVDDLVILVSGICTTTISSIIDLPYALRKVSSWAGC